MTFRASSSGGMGENRPEGHTDGKNGASVVDQTAEVLRQHRRIDAYDNEHRRDCWYCSCLYDSQAEYASIDDHDRHVASVLVEQLGLTQEWATAYERKVGEDGSWHEVITDALPKELAEKNVQMQETNPLSWLRNTHIVSRLVSGWSSTDD
jgi:hypothetical protein